MYKIVCHIIFRKILHKNQFVGCKIILIAIKLNGIWNISAFTKSLKFKALVHSFVYHNIDLKFWFVSYHISFLKRSYKIHSSKFTKSLKFKAVVHSFVHHKYRSSRFIQIRIRILFFACPHHLPSEFARFARFTFHIILALWSFQHFLHFLLIVRGREVATDCTNWRN